MDDTRFDQDIFPLIISIHKQDEETLDYLWSINGLWSYEHLTIVTQSLFSRTHWTQGIQMILSSQTSQDVYNGLPYKNKKKFIHELFYRYASKSDQDTKDTILNSLIEEPYALMSLHVLMVEKTIDNDPLIEKALSNVKMEDYKKMEFESGEEFMQSWEVTVNEFTESKSHTTLVSSVKK